MKVYEHVLFIHMVIYIIVPTTCKTFRIETYDSKHGPSAVDEF